MPRTLRSTRWTLAPHHLALIAALLTLGAHPARAEWKELKSQFGDGNHNMAVAVGGGKTVIVLGTTKGGQGDSPVLFRSTDGGQTFAQGQPPQEGMMAFWSDVWMTSENVGFLAGMDFGAVGFRQTTNGGQSWVKVPSASGSQMYNTLFFLPDGQHGWVVGDEGKLHVTTNTAMWKTVSYDAGDAAATDVCFADAQAGWLVGGASETDQDTGAVTILPKGFVMRSTDGGLTWTTLTSNQPESYSSVWFTSPTTGFVTASPASGGDDVLLRTDNGGLAWTPVALPAHPSGRPIIGLVSSHFASALDGWVVGSAGQDNGGLANQPVALHTTDGGQTWAHEPGYDGAGGAFFDVWAVSPELAFFVGDGGKIERWTEGGFVPPGEGGGEVVIGEDGEVVQPLGPWADVLGGFAEGQVVPQGGQGAGDDVAGAGDGSLPDGTTTQQICTDREVTEKTGCAVGGMAGPGATGAAWLLLGALGALLVLRRRALRARALTTALVAALGVNACGGGETTKTVQECQTVVIDQTFSFDTVGGGDGTEAPPAPTCVITDAKPALTAGGARVAWTNPFVAFARVDSAGVDQVWVLDPATGAELALTELAGPARVIETAWAPDRTRVAFLSDALNLHSTYRANVFVVSLDPAGCFMATPNASEGVFPEGLGSLRLSGFFKGSTGGGGALVAVPGATVASTRGGEPTLTNQGGGFVADVPAADGALVLRLVEPKADGSESYWGGVAAYFASNGPDQNLHTVVGKASVVNQAVDAFAWAVDGAGFDLVHSGVKEDAQGKDQAWAEVARYDPAAGAFAATPPPEGIDTVRRFQPPLTLPSGVRVWAWVHKDGTGKLTFALGDDDVRTLEAPGLFFDAATGDGSRVVVSPQGYLAYVGRAEGAYQLMLVGADETGQLAWEERAAFGGAQVRARDLDWAPDGVHLVATEVQGGQTDLVEIDANTLARRALTTDGRSHAPAWYGR